MKSLAELQALKKQAQNEMWTCTDGTANTRVLVGMATCGIAAGAAPVFQAFTDELARRGVKNVSVIRTGCIGICQYEPVVEIAALGKEKVTYVKMDADKAVRVVLEHLINGNAVTEYTIGAATKQDGGKA